MDGSPQVEILDHNCDSEFSCYESTHLDMYGWCRTEQDPNEPEGNNWGICQRSCIFSGTRKIGVFVGGGMNQAPVFLSRHAVRISTVSKNKSPFEFWT